MAVVYKISCLDTTVKETYVGSTVNFKDRMRCHKKACYNENYKRYNQPIYKFIRENGGWKNWNMNIIDSLTTTDEYEMIKCERKYIEEQQVRLNVQLPTRTKKQYYQDYKEEKLEYQKQYHLDHKEKQNEKSRLYYQDHKEEFIEKQKQYYDANRETILKRQKEKIQCEKCGAFSTRCHLPRHQRTKKCINTTTTTK